MKIAFLLNHFPVLSQTFVLNQITGLLDRGHEVDIYAKSPGKQSVVHADVQRYGLLDRTHYYDRAADRMPREKGARLREAWQLWRTYFPSKPLVLLRSLDAFRFGMRALSLALFFEATHFLEADRYDVVHCHFGPNGNLAARLKAIGAIRGKVVTSFHGEAGYTGEKKYDKGFAPLFKGGDLILPMSEKEKEDLIRLGCPPEKIVIHRMGVDLSKLKFVPRRPRADGQVHLLTVARLVEKKGVEYAIRAVAKLLARHPQLTYQIAGDGPLRDQLETLINELGVGERVRILGWQRQQEIVELLKWADLLLAPSVTSQDGDQEGIPVVLMEALAQGLPVLSTWHAGIPELVRDGESGFLVPERDVGALAAKLECLVERPALWAEMGASGRAHVERHYNIDTLNERLVQLYQQLLERERN